MSLGELELSTIKKKTLGYLVILSKMFLSYRTKSSFLVFYKIKGVRFQKK